MFIIGYVWFAVHLCIWTEGVVLLSLSGMLYPPPAPACNLDSGGTHEGTKCPLAGCIGRDGSSYRTVACTLNNRPLWPIKRGTGGLIQALLWI